MTRRKRESSNQLPRATIIPRDQHRISRKQFSRAALDVLYGLHKAGFQAFLVGGCLRDILTGIPPKDFDVATNASPEQVTDIFKRSRIIGRRFRIVHVRFGREIIEVSTFRALPKAGDSDAQRTKSQSGLVLRDNVFGTLEEDAMRRDFTSNALYYNIADFSLYDFADSLKDIEAKRLRLIGDPETRYREDPVRMLRAARFAAKLGFSLEPASGTPIPKLAELLWQVSSARLFDEQLKLFLSGHSQASFIALEKLGLFSVLFPASAPLLNPDAHPHWRTMVLAAMRNTDDRLANGKGVTPAFLLAVLLWPVVQESSLEFPKAISSAISQQVKVTSIPKRFTAVMRDMWQLQRRLEKRRRPMETLTHLKFRAAYDFLLLRAEAGLLEDASIADWWTTFQHASPDKQRSMQRDFHPKRQPKRRNKPNS